ncbi:MAG TPA: DUF1697 domain-containing protein [Opitutales bacterium]|jgi:uncharacterized protein (DUF1697 family)|nr:DUF1697 domain-containing protein [Opitutales bacterium]
MGQYVALLRGVNVGGNNLIGKDDLRRLFERLKFSNVVTYKQSGNVVFDAAQTARAELRGMIEGALEKFFRKEIRVVVRPVGELQKLVKLNPFMDAKVEAKHCFVSFLFASPTLQPKLPVQSAKGEVAIFLVKHDAAFLRVDRSKGPYADPDKLLKTALGISGTVRNWNTVCALAAMG